MRKIVACILLALQIIAAGCLIGKARADEKAEAKRRAALLADGGVYAMPLNFLHVGGDVEAADGNGGERVYVAWFGMDLLGGSYLIHNTIRFEISETGDLRALWPDEEAEGPVLTLDCGRLNDALNDDHYISPAADSRLKRLLDADYGWFEAYDMPNGVCRRGGERHTVFVRARTLGTDVMFDGLIFDGEFYPFAEP